MLHLMEKKKIKMSLESQNSTVQAAIQATYVSTYSGAEKRIVHIPRKLFYTILYTSLTVSEIWNRNIQIKKFEMLFRRYVKLC